MCLKCFWTCLYVLNEAHVQQTCQEHSGASELTSFLRNILVHPEMNKPNRSWFWNGPSHMPFQILQSLHQLHQTLWWPVSPANIGSAIFAGRECETWMHVICSWVAQSGHCRRSTQRWCQHHRAIISLIHLEIHVQLWSERPQGRRAVLPSKSWKL